MPKIGDKVRVKTPSPGTSLPDGSVWTIVEIGKSGNYRLEGDKPGKWRWRNTFEPVEPRPSIAVGDLVRLKPGDNGSRWLTPDLTYTVARATGGELPLGDNAQRIMLVEDLRASEWLTRRFDVCPFRPGDVVELNKPLTPLGKPLTVAEVFWSALPTGAHEPGWRFRTSDGASWVASFYRLAAEPESPVEPEPEPRGHRIALPSEETSDAVDKASAAAVATSAAMLEAQREHVAALDELAKAYVAAAQAARAAIGEEVDR